MHQVARFTRRILPLYLQKNASIALPFSSCSFSGSATAQPNPRFDLDPSLQTLLQDVDMALHSRVKKREQPLHELEVIPSEPGKAPTISEDYDKKPNNSPRKSPAALFGSQRIGAVVLPVELQDAIQRLISGTNKPQLHSDAKRLFQGVHGDEWFLQYDAKYRTRIQGVKHAKRDGAAFASVVLPAHYSVIVAVLDHVKRRLGSSWRMERVLDWGAGTGSGLWASLYSFQSPSIAGGLMDHLRIRDSTIKSYVGIEKRNGLTEVGLRLVRDLQPEHISVNWQRKWHSEDNVAPLHGGDIVALSAFLLTTLPDALARENIIQQMWDSGANTIILIDHSSKEGFEAIASARQYLLNLGRKGVATGNISSLAAHVVAPCPHDGVCPLHYPGPIKLACGYSQRIQRPGFVRRTKHSTLGYEDIGYSYVVIQRGERPCPTLTGLGRTGAVGKWALEKDTSKLSTRELQLYNAEKVDPNSHHHPIEYGQPLPPTRSDKEYTQEEIDEALRLEAYQWPRLVFPPLKKNGHIILDGCTAEGKIMRMTIPKSQGKQPFYDARKSSWGDIFPHPPKNKPQERQHILKPGSVNVPGSDIGKRRSSSRQERRTYGDIAKRTREEPKKSERKERRSCATWDID